MKPIDIVALFLISAVCAGAAPFQNLGFDEAVTNNLVPTDPRERPIYGDGLGPPEEMMPGWHMFLGTNSISSIGLNLTPPGYGYATLISANPPQLGFVLPVEGLYSLDMLPGSHPITLLQIGEIPTGSKSIQFLSYGSPVQLEVSGSLVPLFYTPLPFDPRIPDYNQPSIAMGDISPFAGQNVELKFIAISEFNQNPYHGLDSISFSPLAIPEPAGVALLSIGLLLLCLPRLCRKRGP
ncbi:MAG: hypothetical protein M1608_12015 [Candidatus Omnitrophica bacterium]|nr:hypothetical protein [Candidatus Omnitrophota bacterium]